MDLDYDGRPQRVVAMTLSQSLVRHRKDFGSGHAGLIMQTSSVTH